MDNLEIGEKEYRLLNQVSKNSVITQREISKRLGFSLGMTNILLKRLIRKGYIKINQLNRRKVQYFLTPAGIRQGIRKSRHYLSYTFHTLREIKSRIQMILLAKYREGKRKFVILGDGELADITELALRNLGKKDITCSRHPHLISSPFEGEDRGEGGDSLFLLTNSRERIKNNGNSSINLLEKITNFPAKNA